MSLGNIKQQEPPRDNPRWQATKSGKVRETRKQADRARPGPQPGAWHRASRDLQHSGVPSSPKPTNCTWESGDGDRERRREREEETTKMLSTRPVVALHEHAALSESKAGSQLTPWRLAPAGLCK